MRSLVKHKLVFKISVHLKIKKTTNWLIHLSRYLGSYTTLKLSLQQLSYFGYRLQYCLFICAWRFMIVAQCATYSNLNILLKFGGCLYKAFSSFMSARFIHFLRPNTICHFSQGSVRVEINAHKQYLTHVYIMYNLLIMLTLATLDT